MKAAHPRRRAVFVAYFLSLTFYSYALPWRTSLSSPVCPRGGSSEASTTTDDADTEVDSELVELEESPLPSEPQEEETAPELSVISIENTKRRRCSDLISNLIERSGVDNQAESRELRHLITMRTEEYIQDLQEESSNGDNKLPDPRKLLHFLAPKIPAIKHSPDVTLRIQAARSDMDSGVAACLLSSLAHACEVYSDELVSRRSTTLEKERQRHSMGWVATDLTKDRRFEQLVECVLCGVDVNKHKKENLEQRVDIDVTPEDIEEILDEENVLYDDGLSVRDACRAAWGLAVLGVHQQGPIAGERLSDLLTVLALRTRELLLARLQLLRRDDLYTGANDGETIDERLGDLSEEVAEDAASALWTFACVRGCTGLASNPVLEVCSSILCQDPFSMRRRAQEAEASLESANVGSSDIVDRLAMSEAVDEEDQIDGGKSADQNDGITSSEAAKLPHAGKDALIDWLSPEEITDVLWALAIHGSRSKDSVLSHDEANLSDTVAALREIAVDRLVGYLRSELQSLEQIDKEIELHTKEQFDQDKVTVEVVDAAALLASENNDSADGFADDDGGVQQVQVIDAAALLASENTDSVDSFPAGVENMALDTVDDDGSVQQVQVIDAAALLATETAQADIEGSTSILNVDETETGNTLDDHVAETSIHSLSPVNDEANSQGFSSQRVTNASNLRFFSLHDLCSIAWAVTELRDPLRKLVSDLVSNIFLSLQRDFQGLLTGSDLSNLGWTLAKNLREDDALTSESSNQVSLLVIEWITTQSLRGFSTDEVECDAVLERFQPPELSRLLWALATIHSASKDLKESWTKDVSRLAQIGLLAAGSNLSIFGAEDLARVTWAFLEVLDLDYALSDSSVAEALGRVLATIEASLLHWEHGKTTAHHAASSDSSDKELTRFASFFGRSRFHIPFLDHKDDEAEEVDEFQYPSLVEKATRLPLLRDLPIDPSTMCKLSCSLVRLAVHRSAFKGNETIFRITLRLLTSRNGRLLRQCPKQDLVRLCEAAASNESVGARELTGLFARRVVRLLNELADDNVDIYSSIRPEDAAVLLWSLGELGVRHQPGDSDRSTAHRRLHLLANVSLASHEQVDRLPDEYITKLLHGLVNLNTMYTDTEALLLVCQSIRGRLSSLVQDGGQVCDLTESLGVLESFVGHERHQGENSTTVSFELLESVDNLLSSTATQLSENVRNLSAAEIRKILTTYTLLPFRADDFINAIYSEVKRRVALLETVSSRRRSKELVQTAASSARAVISSLSSEHEASPLAAVKRGLKSMFHTGDKFESTHAPRSRNDNSERPESDSVGKQVECALASIIEAAESMKEAGDIDGVPVDEIKQTFEDGALFELGRCLELITLYRRIDFDSGILESRFDQERRREMAKRVLSRLQP